MKRRNLARFVTVYRAERFYGGPEEGGWWYTVLEPEHSTKLRKQGDEAEIAQTIESLKVQYPSAGNLGSMRPGINREYFAELRVGDNASDGDSSYS